MVALTCIVSEIKRFFSRKLRFFHTFLHSTTPSGVPVDIAYRLVRLPSHHTKTIKTTLRPENFDERNAGVVKMEKCAVFKFILRLYYVPGKFSLHLTRLCQVLTMSNTFPLISYYAHYHARTTSNALLVRPYYDQSDRTTCLTCAYCVLTASIRSL